jgi:uncharacterized membrane protein YeaQ/YmgE (transglycosylase-associated protein family)
MEIIVWVVTGCVVGWIAFAYLGLNSDRGRFLSMVIGSVGALIGGKALAPMFITAAPMESISLPSVAMAAVAATAVLFVASVVHSRWNV